LILTKIIKTVATRYHIVKLKCTKFDFGRWGSLEQFWTVVVVVLLREGRMDGRENEGEGTYF